MSNPFKQFNEAVEDLIALDVPVNQEDIIDNINELTDLFEDGFAVRKIDDIFSVYNPFSEDWEDIGTGSTPGEAIADALTRTLSRERLHSLTKDYGPIDDRESLERAVKRERETERRIDDLR